MNLLQAKKVIPFAYSSLEKAFEKETKAIGVEGRKQMKPIINQGKRKWV